MTAHIKLSTNEYPRHDGDIAIDPVGSFDYAVVQWTDPPSFDATTQLCVEGAPIQENSVWKMTWVVRDATPEEIDRINKPIIRPLPI
jgi:hypothetical protein